MSRKSFQLSAPLHEYLLKVSLREDDVARRLREETARLPQAGMQIAPEQAQFMSLLARLSGARRALEIGTFTGYSALAVARALPADGTLIACDVNEQWTAIARRYWREAGVDDRIDLRLAPALDTMQQLIADGEAESYDFCFIDADKRNYSAYYERALDLLRSGGLIVVDNVLWSGRVADPSDSDDDTRALRAFNEALSSDDRVDLCMIPIADGVTLALKR